jgi:cytochrome b561
MIDLNPSPLKWTMYDLHKATGITILALVLVRVSWRLSHPVPAPVPMPTWQHWAAEIAHGLLYAAMILLPLTGWLMSSSGGYDVKWYGLFTVPALVEKSDVLFPIAKWLHEYLGYATIGLIVIHVLGALYHHRVLKDATLRRMLPSRWS